MPLYGGVCPYDPEHTPVPEDITDPDIPEWYPSWLHNYQMRDRWPFCVFSAVPEIPEVERIMEPAQSMSALVEDLQALEFGARVAAANERWSNFCREQGFEGLEPIKPGMVGMPLKRTVATLTSSDSIDGCAIPSRKGGKAGGRSTLRPPPDGVDSTDLVASAVIAPRKGKGRGRSVISTVPDVSPAPEVLPSAPQAVARSAILKLPRGSVAEWLYDVDETGCLEVYQEPISRLFSSPAQLVEAYAKEGPDGRRNQLSSDFFQAVSVKKVGHKRLFEKWFNEHL